VLDIGGSIKHFVVQHLVCSMKHALARSQTGPTLYACAMGLLQPSCSAHRRHDHHDAKGCQ
jgi:hypothetical protein